LLDDGIGRLGYDHAAQAHGAAGVRAAAHRDQIGIAGDEAHLRGLHSQPLHDELAEARLVPLPRRKRADNHVDHTLATHDDLRALARSAGGDLDVVAEAEPAAAPAMPRLAPSRLAARPR